MKFHEPFSAFQRVFLHSVWSLYVGESAVGLAVTSQWRGSSTVTFFSFLFFFFFFFHFSNF